MAANAPARPVPTPRPAAQRVAQPGDRICSNCREPNDSTRRFCRRCGTNLATAPIQSAKGPPWWRRIFRRQPKAFAAGERAGSMQKPGPSGGGSKVKPMTLIKGTLAVLVAVGVVGVIAVPSIQGVVLGRGGDIINDIRRFFVPELVNVYASTATPSSEVQDHPGKLLIDRFKNTDWQTSEGTPSIRLTFDAPFDLAAVWVHNGNADKYIDFRRPTKLAFVFPDGSTKEVELTDNHDPQRRDISANGIKSMEVKVVAATGPADAPLAISEIEFIGKR
jgi:hypothetical protein